MKVSASRRVSDFTILYLFSACFSQNESFVLTGMSLRVHPFLYEMSGAPCKFSFCAGFSSYDLEDLRNSH